MRKRVLVPAGWNFGEVFWVFNRGLAGGSGKDFAWLCRRRFLGAMANSSSAIYVAEIKNWRVQKFVK